MNVEMLNRFMELCGLVGIKTMSDLKVFEDCYNLTAPTGAQLITALEKEVLM